MRVGIKILPLLQETLTQLWDRRRMKLVISSDYEALGDHLSVK